MQWGICWSLLLLFTRYFFDLAPCIKGIFQWHCWRYYILAILSLWHTTFSYIFQVRILTAFLLWWQFYFISLLMAHGSWIMAHGSPFHSLPSMVFAASFVSPSNVLSCRLYIIFLPRLIVHIFHIHGRYLQQQSIFLNMWLLWVEISQVKRG